MSNTPSHSELRVSNKVDIEKQRGETIVRSVKKAWQSVAAMGGPSDDISIYLLGVAGNTEGVLLGYDLAEVSAFLGGVIDGEFDALPDVSANVSAKPEPELEPDTSRADWSLAPLPPGMAESALIAAFVRVQNFLSWQVFGGEGGPAWGRVRFSLMGAQLVASPDPALTLAEIRAIARLPHPPPVSTICRGYLVAEEIAGRCTYTT